MTRPQHPQDATYAQNARCKGSAGYSLRQEKREHIPFGECPRCKQMIPLRKDGWLRVHNNKPEETP